MYSDCLYFIMSGGESQWRDFTVKNFFLIFLFSNVCEATNRSNGNYEKSDDKNPSLRQICLPSNNFCILLHTWNKQLVNPSTILSQISIFGDLFA